MNRFFLLVGFAILFPSLAQSQGSVPIPTYFQDNLFPVPDSATLRQAKVKKISYFPVLKILQERRIAELERSGEKKFTLRKHDPEDVYASAEINSRGQVTKFLFHDKRETDHVEEFDYGAQGQLRTWKRYRVSPLITSQWGWSSGGRQLLDSMAYCYESGRRVRSEAEVSISVKINRKWTSARLRYEQRYVYAAQGNLKAIVPRLVIPDSLRNVAEQLVTNSVNMEMQHRRYNDLDKLQGISYFENDRLMRTDTVVYDSLGRLYLEERTTYRYGGPWTDLQIFFAYDKEGRVQARMDKEPYEKKRRVLFHKYAEDGLLLECRYKDELQRDVVIEVELEFYEE